MVEFATILLGLRLVVTCEVGSFLIESDYLNVVNKVCSDGIDLSSVGVCTEMFKILISPLPFQGIFYISRVQNIVANRLASYVLSLCQTMFWFWHMLECIISVVSEDLIPYILSFTFCSKENKMTHNICFLSLFS